jgi:hypothetical protein
MNLENVYRAIGIFCCILVPFTGIPVVISSHSSPMTAAAEGTLAGCLILWGGYFLLGRATIAGRFAPAFRVAPPKLFEKSLVCGNPIREVIQNIINAEMARLLLELRIKRSIKEGLELQASEEASVHEAASWLARMNAACNAEKSARKNYDHARRAALIHGFNAENEPKSSLAQVVV